LQHLHAKYAAHDEHTKGAPYENSHHESSQTPSAHGSRRRLHTDGRSAAGRRTPATTDDTFLAEPVAAKPNLEPAVVRPAQEKAAGERLAALQRKHGHAPNIVVVVMDDVGWGDLGVYRGGLAVGAATPNMDRLAREGLQLLNTYSQPSCTPTRATLMTGQLPIRTGMLRPMLPGEGAGGRGIDPQATLPQKLREAGYITRAVGKWHLGAFKEAQPQNVGFDHYHGNLTSSDDYTAFREPWRNPDLIHDPTRKEFAEKGEVMAIVEGNADEDAQPVFPIDMESIRRVDEQLTNHAVSFIDSTKGGKQPFFLYFATKGAHNDNYPHPDFLGKSLAKYPYKDAIVELDHRSGQPNSGPLRPAILFVHGGAWTHGHRSMLPEGNRWLNALGYEMFDVEYCMSPPVHRPDEIGDVKSALGWVAAPAAEYHVDPARISIMGGSAVGNLSMLAAYSAGEPQLPPWRHARRILRALPHLVPAQPHRRRGPPTKTTLLSKSFGEDCFRDSFWVKWHIDAQWCVDSYYGTVVAVLGTCPGAMIHDGPGLRS
jgi:hypothetical protein